MAGNQSYMGGGMGSANMTPTPNSTASVYNAMGFYDNKAGPMGANAVSPSGDPGVNGGNMYNHMQPSGSSMVDRRYGPQMGPRPVGNLPGPAPVGTDRQPSMVFPPALYAALGLGGPADGRQSFGR